ncbi:MAG: sugar phosphate isomerase/epimerase [ANME-2 cluster archaeon]|nr:sugar phosphate isomerase/epimerase [ANME-2 cluster archaeon]MDF1556896.1 sugar phosphate isomerase/epimerase [ANME-2 cluster archaeon]
MSPGLDPANISFSSPPPTHDREQWAHALVDMGFTGWEMVCDGRQGPDELDIKEIAAILDTTDLTLTVHLPFSDLNLASLNEPIWSETLHQMTEWIQLVAPYTKLAVVHPGHLSPLGMQIPDLAWQRNIQGLQQLCDHAARFDMTIGVENMVKMDFILGKYAEEMLGMIESVDRDNLGMTFDVGHANTNNAVPSFLDKCLGATVHVHLHDNVGRRDEHLPLGEGSVDWATVTGKCAKLDVRYVLESRTFEAAQQSLDYLRAL